MKLSSSIIAVLTLSLVTASADPKSEVGDAIKKLSNQSGYSWTFTPKVEGSDAGRRQSPLTGKTEKNGYTLLSGQAGDVSFDIALKGEKMIVNYTGDWLSTAEIGENNRIVQRLRALKTPVAEAEGLVGKLSALKKEADGAYLGDMEGAAAKEIFALLGRRAAEAQEAKGTVKFWVKDGSLAKYELVVRGTMKVGGEEKRDVDVTQTTTVEIKEVGSTEVFLPEDAQKKLS